MQTSALAAPVVGLVGQSDATDQLSGSWCGCAGANESGLGEPSSLPVLPEAVGVFRVGLDDIGKAFVIVGDGHAQVQHDLLVGLCQGRGARGDGYREQRLVRCGTLWSTRVRTSVRSAGVMWGSAEPSWSLSCSQLVVRCPRAAFFSAPRIAMAVRLSTCGLKPAFSPTGRWEEADHGARRAFALVRSPYSSFSWARCKAAAKSALTPRLSRTLLAAAISTSAPGRQGLGEVV